MPDTQIVEPKKSGLLKMVYALVALALVVAAIVGLRWHFQSQKAQLEFFPKALSEANVSETVSIGSISYTVTRGEVTKNGVPVSGGAALPALRLTYALASARRVPLLGLPGTDSGALAKGTEALVKVSEELATVLPAKTEPYAPAVKEGLYPVQFLRALAATESARQEFLASGTEKSATRYYEALGEAIALYKKDLALYKRAAEPIAKEQESAPKPFSLIDMQGVAVQNPWLKSIENLEDAVGRAEEFLYTPRGRCFGGDISSCDPANDVTLPPLRPMEPTPAPSAQALAKTKTVRELLKKVIGEKVVGNGPVFELMRSVCTPALAQAPPLFIATTRMLADNAQYRALTYVGDMPLLSTDLFPSESGYGLYLHKNGVMWVPMWTGNHYSCPGLGHDLGAVLALEAVARTAKENPFSVDVKSLSAKTLLKDLEGRLAGALVREEDVYMYLSAVQQAFVNNIDISKEALDRFASLFFMYRVKSAGLDSVAWEVVTVEANKISALRATPRRDMGSLTPEFLFAHESGFFSLFLGHSLCSTSWQTPNLTDAPLPKKSYLLLSQLPAQGVTEASIISDLKFFFGVQ